MNFSVIPVYVSHWTGGRLKVEEAFAVALNGRVLLSQEGGEAIWSMNRAEVEKEIETMTAPMREERSGQQA